MFCIKYVAAGSERYILDSNTHEVGEGQYLLVNKGQTFECNFKSNTPVEGFCIGLDDALISGIHNDLSQPEEVLLDDPFNRPQPFTGFHQLVYSRGITLSLYMRRLMMQVDLLLFSQLTDIIFAKVEAIANLVHEQWGSQPCP